MHASLLFPYYVRITKYMDSVHVGTLSKYVWFASTSTVGICSASFGGASCSLAWQLSCVCFPFYHVSSNIHTCCNAKQCITEIALMDGWMST